jgi:uncharacterized protein YejL (UPF0352 family)
MSINLTLEIDEVNGVLNLLNQAAGQAQQLAEQANAAQALFNKVREQAISQVPQEPPVEKVTAEPV